MKEAILARHGETEFSLRGDVNGDPAVANELTAAGVDQARSLGRLIAGDEIDLCVTSEMRRAIATADAALEGRDVPRLVVPELNDIRFGGFEGGPLAAYRAWASGRGPTDLPPGDGESRAQTVLRYVLGFRVVIARPEERILVVAHSLPLAYVLSAAEGGDPKPAMAQVPYAEPYRVEADELERAVARLGAWAAAPAW